MKEEINLLPPPAKQARQRYLTGVHLAYLGRRVGFGWLLLLAVLAGSYGYTWQRQREVDRQLAQKQGMQGGGSSQVQAINEIMSVVRAWADDHPAWTPLLVDALTRMPAAVRLEIVSLQPDGEGLTLRGVSSSRTAVVEMQQELEKLPWIGAIDAPLQNFAAGDKNEFSFTLTRTADEKPSD